MVTRELVLVRFEDAVAWQDARALARAVYARTDGVALAQDPLLAASLRQGASSVMATIAESFREGELGAALRRLRQADEALRELRAMLYWAVDGGLLRAREHDELVALSSRAARTLAELERSLRTSNLVALARD